MVVEYNRWIFFAGLEHATAWSKSPAQLLMEFSCLFHSKSVGNEHFTVGKANEHFRAVARNINFHTSRSSYRQFDLGTPSRTEFHGFVGGP